MQSDAPGWIGICVWSRGKWLFVIFLSCRGVNSKNCISNLRKRMNGMLFHQWQAQRYFHCFLWRLLKVHRSELGEEFWALPETARDSGLIFCWHMPQWNTENKVWATKPIKKEGFWSVLISLGFSFTLLSWVFHWVIVHTVILTIVRLLRAWETPWASWGNVKHK